MTFSNLSIVIPTWQAAATIGPLLDWCCHECSGCEVIVSDGGSTDQTLAVADAFDLNLVTGERGRGAQCARGVAASNRPWVLVLHADSQPDANFATAIAAHMTSTDTAARIAYGWLGFSDGGWRSSLVAQGANLRSRLFDLPYGDQGLLFERTLYDQAGGYPPWPLMEDVELVRRLKATHGKRVLVPLKATIITSPARYERDGYTQRVLRNLSCLLRYYRGRPIHEIATRYQKVTRKC